jgi:phospholipase C
MADTLDAAHVSWKYYAPSLGDNPGQIWSAFDAIKNVRYGPDWSAHVVSPPTQIFTDAAAGKLPAVSWVVPDYLWSDHPYAGTDYGPSWVASVVNKIGTSPEWKSTAIVVVWDDWGGFYDNAPPPQKDFRGLGIRVGCLIVSPYVTAHVDHTQFEFGSILKFVEQAFHLPALGTAANGYTDARATSLALAFNFGASPRPFQKIASKYQASFFAAHGASKHVPDDQ